MRKIFRQKEVGIYYYKSYGMFNIAEVELMQKNSSSPRIN